MGGEEGKQNVGHELRNLSVTLLQGDGFIFTAWAIALGTSGKSLLYLMLLMWNGDLGCTNTAEAIVAALGVNSRRMSLLCSQYGGNALEATPQLEQHSQSSLACFSCRYFWINFGFMWIIQLLFFLSHLKFVLCYLVFLQLNSFFHLRYAFPTKLFYPDIRIITAFTYLCCCCCRLNFFRLFKHTLWSTEMLRK